MGREEVKIEDAEVATAAGAVPIASFRTTGRSNPAIGLAAGVSAPNPASCALGVTLEDAPLEGAALEGAPGSRRSVALTWAACAVALSTAPIGLTADTFAAVSGAAESTLDPNAAGLETEIDVDAEAAAGAVAESDFALPATGLVAALVPYAGLTAVPATTRGPPGSNDSSPRPSARRFSGGVAGRAFFSAPLAAAVPAACFPVTSPTFSATFVMVVRPYRCSPSVFAINVSLQISARAGHLPTSIRRVSPIRPCSAFACVPPQVCSAFTFLRAASYLLRLPHQHCHPERSTGRSPERSRRTPYPRAPPPSPKRRSDHHSILLRHKPALLTFKPAPSISLHARKSVAAPPDLRPSFTRAAFQAFRVLVYRCLSI
jgi:hypothetical protein